jgi:hypothetical protein
MYLINVRLTEGAIKNGQSRDTINIGYTRHKTKKPILQSFYHQKHIVVYLLICLSRCVLYKWRGSSLWVIMCCLYVLSPCYDVCYDIRIKTIFGSSLSPVVCRRAHVLLRMFGSSFPPVVCRRAHILFKMFGSSFPK